LVSELELASIAVPIMQVACTLLPLERRVINRPSTF
jgi:hypothetical protein